MSSPPSAPRSQREPVEDFLYMEAQLLDRWQLDEWLKLFAEDSRYVVPSTDLPSGDPRRNLVLIDDDFHRLSARVDRLKSRRAHREFPHSRTHRVVSNVIINGVDPVINVESSLVMYRYRDGDVAVYVARALYQLVDGAADGDFIIKYRRMELEMESLSPHGTVSTIL